MYSFNPVITIVYFTSLNKNVGGILKIVAAKKKKKICYFRISACQFRYNNVTEDPHK